MGWGVGVSGGGAFECYFRMEGNLIKSYDNHNVLQSNAYFVLNTCMILNQVVNILCSVETWLNLNI